MKPYVEYDAMKHGKFRVSNHFGKCKWCGQPYYQGTKVNWNPRVGRTCCHAGCYGEYGSPVVVDTPVDNPTPTPTFVPNPNAPKSEPIAEKATDLQQTIADAIIPYLEGRLKGLVTEQQVSQILDKVLDGRAIRTITTITIEQETENGFETRDLGVQHKSFPLLLNCLKARHEDYRLNIMLIGPAGTGKTTAARKVAEALGLRFGFTGAIDTKYDYLGYFDANGKLVRTAFREFWEHGGVWLQDEMDGSNAAALLPLNAGLANHVMAFPDGLVEQHPDCIIICAMNTWGLSATNDFVGRTKLDATTLNRFVPIYWDNDDELEHATAQNTEWTNRVQRVRLSIKAKGIKGVMVTPRQSQYGAALLKVGIPQNIVEDMLLKQSMSDSQWNDVKGSN